MNHKQIVDYWFSSYKTKTGLTPKWTAKEGKLLKDLIIQAEKDNLKQEDILSSIDWYLDQDEGFIAEDACWNFGVFCSKFQDIYIACNKEFNKKLKEQEKKKQRDEEYKKFKKELDSRPVVYQDRLNHTVMAKFLRDKYYHMSDGLERAVKLMSFFSSPNVRKKHAMACCLVWGEEIYVEAYNEIFGKGSYPSTREGRKQKYLEKSKAKKGLNNESY